MGTLGYDYLYIGTYTNLINNLIFCESNQGKNSIIIENYCYLFKFDNDINKFRAALFLDEQKYIF